MKNIRPEDLGNMAESSFKILCKSAGLIANSSDDDKGGWDYVVEHPRDNTIDYSNRSYPVYRVQVKSTQSEKNQVQITYSNLLKLIEYSGASFIILLKYSETIDPKKAFLLHIDENFSKEILVEIRKKQLKNTGFLLHKQKKSINFNNANEIDPKDGNSLVSALKNSIGSDYLKYIEQKISYLSKLEREGRKKEATITLNSESDIRAMANCFLGYNEKFHMDTQGYNSPFGIRDKQPIFSEKNYQTIITPINENLKEAKIFIKYSEFGKQFEFSGVLFNVPRELPNEVLKMRIKTTLFDFIYSPYSSELSFNFKDIANENIKVKFKELYNYFCVLNGLHNDSSLYINIEAPNGSMSPELSLSVPKFKLFDNFSNIFIGIESAYKKASVLNIEEEIISTLSIWERTSHFYFFSIVGKKYEPAYVFEFEASSDTDKKANVVIFSSTIEFDKKTLLSISAFYGSMKKIRENIFLGCFYKSKLMGEYVLNSTDDLKKLTKEKLEKHKEELSKTGLSVL